MENQKNKPGKETAAQLDEQATLGSKKVKRYIINKQILAKLEKKREEQRRRARRFVIDSELLEANGIPGRGSRIIDLSMNGAKLRLAFSPPFMSQISLKFSLQGSTKIFTVMGRVIWSRMTMQRGWYDVGVQFYQNYWEIDQLLRLENR